MIMVLIFLLSEQVLKVFGRERDDLSPITRILFDDSFRVVLEDVWEFIRYHYLLGTIYALLSNIGHFCILVFLNI